MTTTSWAFMSTTAPLTSPATDSTRPRSTAPAPCSVRETEALGRVARAKRSCRGMSMTTTALLTPFIRPMTADSTFCLATRNSRSRWLLLVQTDWLETIWSKAETRSVARRSDCSRATRASAHWSWGTRTCPASITASMPRSRSLPSTTPARSAEKPVRGTVVGLPAYWTTTEPTKMRMIASAPMSQRSVGPSWPRNPRTWDQDRLRNSTLGPPCRCACPRGSAAPPVA